MLFALFAIPLIEELAGLLLTWMKVSEVKASVKIAKMQQEVAEMQEPPEPKKRPIGFCVTPEPEELVEEEEDNYDD